MRDGFGIPRDQVIIKAKKAEPQKTSGVPSAALGLAGLTAGSAGKVMYDEHREVAGQHEKWGKDAFKSGKKSLRGTYRKQNAEIKDLDKVRGEKLQTAGKNGSLKRLVNQSHSEEVANTKAHYGAKRFQHRASLRASVKQAKFAEAAHGSARKAAIVGGAVAAPLLAGAVLARPKEKVMKDAFGIDRGEVSKAFNPVKSFKQGRQVKRSLKMVGASNKRAIIQGARKRLGQAPTMGDVGRGLTTQTTGMKAVNNRRYGPPPPKGW